MTRNDRELAQDLGERRSCPRESEHDRRIVGGFGMLEVAQLGGPTEPGGRIARCLHCEYDITGVGGDSVLPAQPWREMQRE